MREQYWYMYQNFKYRFFYYKRFKILFSKINWIITALCGLTTLSSVAAWGIWKSHPLAWSILICFSQLVQALFPKNPYNDLLISTTFMLCEFDKLLLEIEHGWLAIELNQYSDEQILEFIRKYELKHAELISQFFSGTYLPELKHCCKKAEEECAAYFSKYISI